MSTTPIIYRSPLAYRGIMRVLYGRHFRDRYEAVAAEVPAGSDVVEVCAGDCYLYTELLREKGVRYRALDLSPEFVRHARARGIEARVFDLAGDEEVPAADVVVVQASLYQFMPGAAVVLRKLLAAARSRVVVAEPVRNLSDSSLGWVATVSRRLTRVGDHGADGGAPARFDETSLAAVFAEVGGLERSYLIPGGREMVGVLRGARA